MSCVSLAALAPFTNKGARALTKDGVLDMLKMTSLISWWKRTLINLVICITAIGVILFLAQRVYLARLGQTSIDNPTNESLLVANDPGTSNTDNRVSTLQERLKQNPNDQAAYVQLGAAYLQKARETGDPTYYTQTEGVLQRALELKPQDLSALVQMGALDLSRHQFHEALALGQQAQALNSTIPIIYGVIGDAQTELGLYDQALQSVQVMVDMRPDLSSYSRASYVRELHGDVAGAIEAMRRAVRAGGPNAENTNWTRVQLGNLYFNSSRLTDAETQYTEALAAYPGYVHAIASLARVHAARREYDEAIKLYIDVVNRFPLPEYVIALGDVYEAAGRMSEAQQQFNLVRAIERLYVANGVDTDLETALFEADHYQDQDMNEILARAQRALDKRSTIYAKDVMAWALYQAGQYAAADDFSRQALQLGTQDALLLFHAGMIADRLGHTAEAQADLEQALSINPNFSIRYRDLAQNTLSTLRQSNVTSGLVGAR
jgi:tetratricopeptide (TPR) repeat protein